MKRYTVITIPRAGTHFVTRSISKSLGIPYAMSYPLDTHEFPIEPDWILGTHTFYNAPYTGIKPFQIQPESGISEVHQKLLNHSVIPLVVERNALDNLLSFVAFDKAKIPVNSEEFVNSRHVKAFFVHYYQLFLWKKHAEVFSYDLLKKNDSSELERLSDLIGAKAILESKEVTSKHALTAMGKGTTNLWKDILTQETVDLLTSTYEIDCEELTSNQVDPKKGQEIFEDTYYDVYSDGFNFITNSRWDINEKLLKKDNYV